MSDLSILEKFDEILPAGQKLTDAERRDVQEICDRIARDGALCAVDGDGSPVLDAAGRPVPRDWQTVRGRRFLVDSSGTIWRFLPRGGPKDRRNPAAGGPPRRFNGVEMWTGKWRPCVDPASGKGTYAKRTMVVPIDPNINAHPHISNIEWYRTEKGFKHPFDPPDCPTEMETRGMDRRRLDIVEAVYAKMGELAADGLDVQKLKAADARKGER